MLISVQLPIIDLRGFATPTGRLSRPGWPAPEADEEFLRAFGAVRRRPSGGINGWLGESAVCEAFRGARFAGPLPRVLGRGRQGCSFHVVYRRFFFDGLATGKLELGFQARPEGPSVDMANVVSAVLKLPLIGWGGCPRALGVVGTDTARNYARATTAHNGDFEAAQRFVLAGRPCVIIDQRGVMPRTPREANDFSPRKFNFETGVWAHFWHQREFGQDIPVWHLYRYSNEAREASRQMRLYLSRFHAETEALAKTLKAISEEVIAPELRSEQSNLLQKFLLDTLRHQRRAGEKIDQQLHAPFYAQALWYRDYSLPGHYDSLVARLEQMQPRKAVLKNVTSYLQLMKQLDGNTTIAFIGDHSVTTNITNNGNAGIIGQTVDAQGATAIGAQTTLGGVQNQAIKELNLLAKHLLKEAKSPDEEVAAEAVKKAAEKLEGGDEQAALAWLKRSGSWALKVAESISAKLAAELIVRASTS